jgi:hypothetical protein
MARRKLGDKNIRKLSSNSRSIAVTLPIEFIRKLKWRKKQKVVLKLKGKKITIEDWKK